ncbi:protease inhibitor I42 family protein [Entomomonas sp. E2T0]|uniref:protease inhibitor I42 family protein n=1 Tax=Entomomonas sp. E2T0 TaxID=2930213 RepID=UPI0022282000|nr:protease inhibitor I42 family protein [Entomomonas sp. E2T0]UYZ84163.1 protease inhibitor I42 family protein [Entomomonas sp. E2T0]
MIKKIIFRLITITLISLSITACVSTSPAKTINNKNYQTLCNPLILHKNQELIVALPSSAHSGYKWQLENDATAILQLNKNHTQKDDHPENHLHRQETIWKFKAIKSGTGTLSFIYRLDWDTNIEDNQHIQCEINVNDN